MNRSRFLGRSGYGSYSSYLPTSTTSISYSSYLSRPGGISSTGYGSYGTSSTYTSALTSPRRRYVGALTDSISKEKNEPVSSATLNSTRASTGTSYRGARSHTDLNENSKPSESSDWRSSASRFSTRNIDDAKETTQTRSKDYRRSNDIRTRSASRGRDTDNLDESPVVSVNRGVTSRLVRSSSYGELSQRGASVGVDEDEPEVVRAPSRARRARQRHQTLTFGVSPDDLRRSKEESEGCRGFHSEMSAAAYEPSKSSSSLLVMPKSILRSRRRNEARASDQEDLGYGSRRGSLSSSEHISTLTVAALEREARLVSYISALRKEMESVLPHDNTDHDHSNNVLTANVAANSQSGSAFKEGQAQQLNPDYKKLWEESQKENAKLREDIRRIKEELVNTRRQLENAKITGASAEGKDRVLLERKLNEMEEELKLLAFSENLVDQQLEQLRSDNQRLRDENVALVRVISKLSR